MSCTRRPQLGHLSTRLPRLRRTHSLNCLGFLVDLVTIDPVARPAQDLGEELKSTESRPIEKCCEICGLYRFLLRAVTIMYAHSNQTSPHKQSARVARVHTGEELCSCGG